MTEPTEIDIENLEAEVVELEGSVETLEEKLDDAELENEELGDKIELLEDLLSDVREFLLDVTDEFNWQENEDGDKVWINESPDLDGIISSALYLISEIEGTGVV